MANRIASSYMEGNVREVAQVGGFVMAQEVFNLLKVEAGIQLAAEFYDRWCYYRYTGRIMEA